MRSILGGVLAVTLSLGLAACGGDDDDAVATTTTSAVVTTETSPSGTPIIGDQPEDNPVAITISGAAFDKEKADAYPGPIRFVITNQDRTKHSFTIDGTDIDIEFDGEGISSVDSALAVGEYTYHCKIHSSMTGTLTVA